MAGKATMQDYNAHSRDILMKLEIYLDGASNSPLVVTTENYLINCDILEELCTENSNPLGAISANEVSFSLLSRKGLFNPANTESIYYGKMAKDVLVIPYFKLNKVDITEWDPAGKYYVTEWVADSGGIQANVTAQDPMQQIFRLGAPALPVMQNKVFSEFFTDVFTALGRTAVVDPSISEVLPFAYTQGKPAEFLQEMVNGALCYCYCDALGNVQIKKFDGSGDPVATLTDADQIVDITVSHTIAKAYDGVQLTYNKPQISQQSELLRVDALDTPTGTKEHDVMCFQKTPVKDVRLITTSSVDNGIFIDRFEHTTENIRITTKNNGARQDCALTVHGIMIENVEYVLTDEVENLLKVTNKYIQTDSYALAYKELLNRFVNNPIPFLKLTIRGNPLLLLGDRILIQSDKYSITFSGILYRIEQHYTGALTCDLTLLNALVLGGS